MEKEVCVVTQPLGSRDTTATQQLLDVLSALTSVSLITMALSDNAVSDEYEIIELSGRNTPDSIPVAAVYFILNQIRMSRTLWHREEEIILFFGPIAYVLPIIVARLAGKTVVLEPRANVPLALRVRWEQRVPRHVARVLAGCMWLLERIGYRLAHAIITYTPTMATELDLDRYDHKLYTNGARFVDTDEFTPRVPYEQRDSVVGYLGRLDEEKGIRTLAAVAKTLPDDVTFRFVGGGQLSDWLTEELEKEIEAGSVEVEGWVDHSRVPAELSQFQLLVLPSPAAEGLPTVILEALACGTPAYATPVSGVPDIVREGETGFLLNNPRPEAIVSGLDEILDRADLAEISANGRELIESEYSFDGAVDRYDRILHSISDQS